MALLVRRRRSGAPDAWRVGRLARRRQPAPTCGEVVIRRQLILLIFRSTVPTTRTCGPRRSLARRWSPGPSSRFSRSVAIFSRARRRAAPLQAEVSHGRNLRRQRRVRWALRLREREHLQERRLYGKDVLARVRLRPDLQQRSVPDDHVRSRRRPVRMRLLQRRRSVRRRAVHAGNRVTGSTARRDRLCRPRRRFIMRQIADRRCPRRA